MIGIFKPGDARRISRVLGFGCDPGEKEQLRERRGKGDGEGEENIEMKERRESRRGRRNGLCLYGQLNEITRNRKLSDVPILLERPSAPQKWCPWAELVAHNVDVHDDVRDDIPERGPGAA